MRRALSALLLLFAFLFIFTGTASARVDTGLENRIWDFSENPNIDTYGEWPLARVDAGENTTAIYDPATGVVFYVNQNPWTFFDPLGLLTKKERKVVRENDEKARTIIKKHGNDGETGWTPDRVKEDSRLEPNSFSNSYNLLTDTGRLRKQYPGESLGDIAIIESARRNLIRAKVLLAGAGELPQKERNQLNWQIYTGMLDLTVITATIPFMGIKAPVRAAVGGAATKAAAEATAANASKAAAPLKNLSGSIDDAANAARTFNPQQVGVNANTLNHVFGQAKHNLQPLVNSFGGQRNAFSALHNATTAATKVLLVYLKR